MIRHLTIRAPWHDTRWNGSVCRSPKDNSYCIALDRIREERQDDAEELLAGSSWANLEPAKLPPCIAENGGFMSPKPWARVFNHPYISSSKQTHGQLKSTRFEVPEYSALAVPFWYMLKGNQNALQDRLAEQLPADVAAPFNTAWVFGSARQEALLEYFNRQLTPEESLAVFYTKEGQPVSESLNRLIVGVGRVLSVGGLWQYDSEGDTFPLWERVIRHSIRPEGADGFLLPYQDYLEPTGDEAEDARRLDLLQEVAVSVESGHMDAYSYASQLAGPDSMLSTLVKVLESVRAVRRHGIAKGDWGKREEWLNAQIAKTWRQRGAFPGTGAALEALGLRLGTALFYELMAKGDIKEDSDPWGRLNAILKLKIDPPQDVYKGDLAAVSATWVALPDERRDLLKLLSRFDLTPEQAKRWFDSTARSSASRFNLSDRDILANPYCISEADLGSFAEPAISVGMIDRGLWPDDTVRVKHPVPEPSCISSNSDWRRIRAALVSVLQQAGLEGDALLSETEALDRLKKLDLNPAIESSQDWLTANEANLEKLVQRISVLSNKETEQTIASLQLVEFNKFETWLAKVLKARAEKTLAELQVDWQVLLDAVLEELGVNKTSERYKDAIAEQAKALKTITSRKCSVLTGRAGTGKTTVLAALLQCEEIKQDGILLLAPTGKARVRLANVTDAEALTIAQFLFRLGRYDGERQRPLHKGENKHRQQKTVIIDECSMLTLDTLHAIFQALDMGHVQRLILVGDPNQLPPIGVGRPFADFISFLENEQASNVGAALARLSVEVRATLEGPSDTLRLASWFTRELQRADADEVLSKLKFGETLNDVAIACWKTPEELKELLVEQFQEQLGLTSADDVAGFNKALGLNDKGWVPFEDPKGIDNFQLLSPVRMHPYGVFALNRWVQSKYRSAELKKGRGKYGKTLGDEDIVVRDKVIQVVNQRNKNGFNWLTRKNTDDYLANGEIGMIARQQKGFFNVIFSDRPNITYGYSNKSFGDNSAPLELAYALTIHKSQGSEFEKVFVIVPKATKLLSRELIYTAMTRSRQQLVLLVEGDDASILFDLTKPERSQTGLRNTNLFFGVVRQEKDLIPYAEHLIHKTLKGHMVRSKSELVIANELFHQGIDYEYEREFEGVITKGIRLPDFSFVDAAGDVVIWEHLGMLSRPDYRVSWDRKRLWYEQNGYVENENLFVTSDDERGGLDASSVQQAAQAVKDLI